MNVLYHRAPDEEYDRLASDVISRNWFRGTYTCTVNDPQARRGHRFVVDAENSLLSWSSGGESPSITPQQGKARIVSINPEHRVVQRYNKYGEPIERFLFLRVRIVTDQPTFMGDERTLAFTTGGPTLPVKGSDGLIHVPGAANQWHFVDEWPSSSSVPFAHCHISPEFREY
jgi:hypothetical protein